MPVAPGTPCAHVDETGLRCAEIPKSYWTPTDAGPQERGPTFCRRHRPRTKKTTRSTPGRPALPPDRLRSVVIKVRLAPPDALVIQDLARQAGVKPAELMHALCTRVIEGAKERRA